MSGGRGVSDCSLQHHALLPKLEPLVVLFFMRTKIQFLDFGLIMACLPIYASKSTFGHSKVVFGPLHFLADFTN